MTIETTATIETTGETTNFTGYLCWSRAYVAETINTEAVHANPEVFLATHRPLAVLRRAWGSSGPGDQVDERAVLDDFANRRPTGGVVLMPVIGESGTGKSHLVRWIGEHLPNTSTRRVIYLRKTETNLSAVIRALLADLADPKFQDIRDRVSRNIGQYDPRRLPHELLDRLALAVQFADTTDTAETGDPAMARALAEERGLPTLLRDYEYRQHLLGPDSVLTRFAAELRRGRRDDEGERPTGFVSDDLLVEVDHSQMGPVASAFYRQLVALPEIREQAARLLTKNLSGAVLRLTDLDGGRLAETMIDIRREFHRRGQEIVLLVEDFALIQGIQRDLLDAISEAGVHYRGHELATVRTLMAVTSGYFDALPETIKTRAAASVPHVYELDVPLSDGAVGVGDQQVVDFVARYLNAARTGQAALIRAHDENAGSADWVPNACGPCQFRHQCHEAFGESSEGFGLYPYNRSAVLRAVRVTSERDVVTFNPRRVLSRVVRQVLDNYDTAIRDGKFPPRAFRKDFPRGRLVRPLSSEVEARLPADPVDHERRVDLLDFWGDPAAGMANLHAGIHETFQLPPLPDSVIDAPVPAASPTPMVSDTPTPPPPKALQMKLDNVDAWYPHGGQLSQELARDLRKWLRDAVIARVPWNELGLPHPTDDLRRAVLRDGLGHRDGRGNAVTIEAAYGDKSSGPPGRATIVLERSARTATMIKAIVQRVERGDWNFVGGPRQQRLLSRRLDEWGASMIAAVREHVGLHRPQTITAAVEASLLGARLLDLPASRGVNREDLVAAVLDPGPGGRGVATHKDTEARAPEWTRLASQHLAVRGTLVAELRRAVGAAQGGGAEQLVDATVLVPAIDAFIADWRLKDHDQLPEWVDLTHSQLRRNFDTALQAQWTRLRDMAAEYRKLAGDAEPDVLFKELEAAVAALSTAAPGAGGRSSEEWLEVIRQARRYPWAKWRQLAEELNEPDAPQTTVSTEDDMRVRRLCVAATDRGEQFTPVLPFLRQCGQWLDEGQRQAKHQRDNPPADPLPGLKQVLTGISTLLNTWRETPNG